MFRSIAPRQAARITITIDGRARDALAHATVAEAMLEAGLLAVRAHPVGGEPRGPYCLIGSCFECLVKIDGAPSRQACMVQVAPGMRIERMPACSEHGC